MGAAVEAHPDFVLGNCNIGRHIDEVAEDLARLGIIVAAHAASHQTIEAEARTRSAISKSTLKPTDEESASMWKKRTASHPSRA